jgi:hypothetical protein
MKKIIAVILCLVFLPTTVFADAVAAPKVASIKEGQKAPFTGYLFDSAAFATIEIDKQEIIKKCELDKDLLTKKCNGECTFLKDSCKVEKETIEKTLKIQLDSKDKEIKRLSEILLEPKPSRGLWFGIGAATGIVVSLTTVYLVKKL